LDIYGKTFTFAECSLKDCPFRYQGQYEDAETGLYYNRFRYYDPDSGNYLSQDPIGLDGGDKLYAYVHDPNGWTDVLGLRGNESYPSWMGTKTNYERHHIIPYEYRNHKVFQITGMNVNNATNMVYLPTKESVHPTKAVHNYFKLNGKPHNDYNKAMYAELENLKTRYNSEGWDVERLRKELLELEHNTRKKLNNARTSCH
jgi:RHS repeat-associated protein